MVANSDIFNQDEVDLLETLYLSPNVFLLGTNGSSVTPIVITDTNFIQKKNVNERSPFIYQVKFKYAKERPTTKGRNIQRMIEVIAYAQTPQTATNEAVGNSYMLDVSNPGAISLILPSWKRG
jgi:hypothetical protein